MLELNFTERENMKKLFRDSLVIYVNDLGLDLTMSTVTGLADLAEDEIIVPPIPLEVSYIQYYLHMLDSNTLFPFRSL